MGIEPMTPGLRDQCSTTELKRHLQTMFGLLSGHGSTSDEGSVAEWSKALVLGTSLSGRGFESHRCQYFLPTKSILFVASD